MAYRPWFPPKDRGEYLDTDADKERFPTTEVARFLRVNPRKLRSWAKKAGLLHKVGRRNRDALFWLTAWGAMQAIAHFRALQGQKLVR